MKRLWSLVAVVAVTAWACGGGRAGGAAASCASR